MSTTAHTDGKTEFESMSKDQQIEYQKAAIEKLSIANDKLQKKLEYYENFVENVAQFEKSQKVMDLKGYIQAVRKSISEIKLLRISKTLTASLRLSISPRKNWKLKRICIFCSSLFLIFQAILN